MKDNLIFKEASVEIEFNPKIYSLNSVLSAAYIMTDRAYFVVDGDPKRTIKVLLRPKGKSDLRRMAYEFNDQVLNYSVYDQQSEKHKSLREEMLRRALLTNLADDDYIKDEEEILVPWEEKYG